MWGTNNQDIKKTKVMTNTRWCAKRQREGSRRPSKSNHFNKDMSLKHQPKSWRIIFQHFSVSHGSNIKRAQMTFRCFSLIISLSPGCITLRLPSIIQQGVLGMCGGINVFQRVRSLMLPVCGPGWRQLHKYSSSLSWVGYAQAGDV